MAGSGRDTDTRALYVQTREPLNEAGRSSTTQTRKPLTAQASRSILRTTSFPRETAPVRRCPHSARPLLFPAAPPPPQRPPPIPHPRLLPQPSGRLSDPLLASDPCSGRTPQAGKGPRGQVDLALAWSGDSDRCHQGHLRQRSHGIPRDRGCGAWRRRCRRILSAPPRGARPGAPELQQGGGEAVGGRG